MVFIKNHNIRLCLTFNLLEVFYYFQTPFIHWLKLRIPAINNHFRCWIHGVELKKKKIVCQINDCNLLLKKFC